MEDKRQQNSFVLAVETYSVINFLYGKDDHPVHCPYIIGISIDTTHRHQTNPASSSPFIIMSVACNNAKVSTRDMSKNSAGIQKCSMVWYDII